MLICGTVFLVCLCTTEDWSEYYPSQETIVVSLYGIAFISIAAIPLAIRDFFSGEDKELIWLPDEKCVSLSARFANCLLARDFNGAFNLLHPEEQSCTSLDEFISTFASIWDSLGNPEWICDVRELKLKEAKSCSEYDHLSISEELDAAMAVTEVIFVCSQKNVESEGLKKHLLRLYLYSDDQDYRVVAFTCVPHVSLD